MMKPAVLHLTPHIPLSEKEKNGAFHILLLYSNWPDGDEKNLVPDGSTAVETLQYVKDALPEYVKITLEKRLLHESNLRNTGTPVAIIDPIITTEEFDDFLHDAHGLDDAAINFQPDDLADVTADPMGVIPSSRIYENAPKEHIKYLMNYITNLNIKY